MTSKFKNMAYTMTDEEKKAWKKTKLKAITDYHAELIEDLGIEMKQFNMKFLYTDGGVKTVRMFPNEFLYEKGYFFELIDSNLDPTDPDRTVYRLAYNPNFAEEYEMATPTQYSVPLDELRIVNPASVAISKSSAVFASDKLVDAKKISKEISKEFAPKVSKTDKFSLPLEHDAPMSEMTIRDYMAIHTKAPVSLKPWLNDLIKSSK